MKTFNVFLKDTRKTNKLLVREVAEYLHIDSSMITRFENGTRLPTKDNLIKLSEILKIQIEILTVQWLSAKVLLYLNEEQNDLSLKALLVAEDFLKYNKSNNSNDANSTYQFLIDELNNLKTSLDSYRNKDSYKIAEALKLEYTYESNKIEGNTLTLQETDIVINEGITISGKSMREHLEAINHNDAIELVKELATNKNAITEANVLRIHNLVLRGIDTQNAGKYRSVQVMIKGSKFMPPQPFLVPKQMEDLFFWYNKNKKSLHPVLLAAEMHERIVTIYPFFDGNERTSRLIMNLILIQNGYVIANIKGDYENRNQYYNSLETAQYNNDKELFLTFICNIEKECLEKYITILKS